jgi:succinyl-diaminopimelate desuccinylase
MHETVRLAQELIRVDTSEGSEDKLIEKLAPRLKEAGLRVQRYPLAEGRSSLVASLGNPRLTFTGHLDTVPFNSRGWSVDPTAAILRGDRLFGRGASDMKAGVAAMVTAVTAHLHRQHECAGVRLVLTAGEELGCLGAQAIRAFDASGSGELLVVGEPTSNEPCLGHKGATWFEVLAKGRSAHGSRPDLGRNAVVELARLALTIIDCFPAFEHDPLGAATINLGSFHGGSQPNLVPDEAIMSLDVRTVPGFQPTLIEDLIEAALGGDYSVRRVLDLPAVWSAPERHAISRALDVVASVLGRPVGPHAASYFTDASVLAGDDRYETVLILGPGDSEQAHVVDESCSVGRIEEATIIYEAMLDEWCSTIST